MTDLLTARKLAIKVISALVLLILVMLMCSLTGTEHISLKSVFTGTSQQGMVNTDYEIFVHVRLPRIILAAIVGAALACSGVVFQALLRNPLADPYILGISSGAGLGVIIAVISGVGWTLWGRSPIAKSQQIHSTIFWLMGNMAEENFSVLWLSAGCVMAGIIALFYISPQLNALSFGIEDAKSMGINTAGTQTIAFAIAAAITAVAVSLSGLIGFVGLIVPHGIRLVFGPDHRQLLPLSGITGAIFLVAADTLARVIVAPAQLPVGVITAIVGGPFFLILLIKYTKTIGWFNK